MQRSKQESPQSVTLLVVSRVRIATKTDRKYEWGVMEKATVNTSIFTVSSEMKIKLSPLGD